MFSFLVFTHYDGLITSLMTFRQPPPKIKSISNLLWYDGELKTNEFFYKIFQTTPNNSQMFKVYELKLKDNPDAVTGYKSDEILAALKKDPSTFVLGTTAFLYDIFDKVDFIGSKDLSAPSGWGFQNNSELVDLFNSKFRILKESGVLKKIHDKWFYWMQPDIYESGKTVIDEMIEGVDSLGFENLSGPFLITLFGVTLAIIVVVCEKIHATCKRQETKDDDK